VANIYSQVDLDAHLNIRNVALAQQYLSDLRPTPTPKYSLQTRQSNTYKLVTDMIAIAIHTNLISLVSVFSVFVVLILKVIFTK